MGTLVKTELRLRGSLYNITLNICNFTVEKIFKEIHSPENKSGAQRFYRVHEPTLDQLLNNYIITGGLQRCVDEINMPRIVNVEEHK